MSKHIKRMLVASSEEILRTFLQKELRNQGYQLAIAKDGIEALYLINTLNMTENTFDFYLIDTDLSKFNYISLIIRIQELKISAPIILITSDTNLHTGSESFTYPDIGFLKKPFLKDELISIIDSYVTN
jgi:DNA-binding NtrC family response regulator